MGNLIGESLPRYVGDQIIKRQKIYGSGTPGNTRSLEEISYLNSRNGWVKFASGTSLDQERLDLLSKNNPMLDRVIPGSDLAEKNVLFGGLSSLVGTTLEPRQGIEGINRAYGVGGNEFGFSPMPGIIDVSIQSLNRGSLKKATINIKAHNKYQLDVIDVLYMRLGYTILLEWGNDKYFDNDSKNDEGNTIRGELTDMGPTLIEKSFFKTDNDSTDYAKWLKLIEIERKEKSGNYEAMFGVISNFSWTFENDGSYSVKVDVMSMGDVIESLKVNIPISNTTTISEKDVKKVIQPEIQSIEKEIPKRLTTIEFVKTFVEIEEDDPIYQKMGNDVISSKIPELNNNNYFLFQQTNASGGEDYDELYKVYFKDEMTEDKFYEKYVIYEQQNITPNDYWIDILADERIYNYVKEKGGKGLTKSYAEVIKEIDKVKEEKEEEKEEVLKTQITKLKESKIHYLFFRIRQLSAGIMDEDDGMILCDLDDGSEPKRMTIEACRKLRSKLPKKNIYYERPETSLQIQKQKEKDLESEISASLTRTFTEKETEMAEEYLKDL